MIQQIGIIGVGVLGGAISTVLKSFDDLEILEYDKYKSVGSFEKCIVSDLLFICLPTLFDEINQSYDKTEIYNVFELLNDVKYRGIILLKSTVEPGTTNEISKLYPDLNIIHNPEFLSARTAVEDFQNQSHIILGILENTPTSSINSIINFYKTRIGSDIKISITTSYESEAVKLFCNSFYAVKVHYFSVMRMFCDARDIKFENVRDCMLLNGWINPQHTNAPGRDGLLSFGGACFPKDIKALNAIVKKNDIPNDLLQSVIKENIKIRGTAV